MVEWFATQPPAVQRLIVGHIPKEMQKDVARHMLANLAGPSDAVPTRVCAKSRAVLPLKPPSYRPKIRPASWRNWQTRWTKILFPKGRIGSTPIEANLPSAKSLNSRATSPLSCRCPVRASHPAAAAPSVHSINFRLLSHRIHRRRIGDALNIAYIRRMIDVDIPA